MSLSDGRLWTVKTKARNFGPGSVLTHAGGDVVQVGVQRAGAQFLVVRDVGLQEGHPELPLVHHADQAASGLAGGLTCFQRGGSGLGGSCRPAYLHTH